MSGGRIVSQGTLQEVTSGDSGSFISNALASSSNGEVCDANNSDTESDGDSDSTSDDSATTTDRISQHQDGSADSIPTVTAQPLTTANIRNQTNQDQTKKEKGKLVQDEKRERGSVDVRVYLSYVKACSPILVCVSLLCLVINNSCMTAKDYWLSLWAADAEKHVPGGNASSYVHDERFTFFLGGFALLSTGAVVFVFVASLIMHVVTLHGANTLHLGMLRNIVHVPQRFFETTPVGRILNRLSSDTAMIDVSLPEAIIGLLKLTLTVLVAMVVAGISSPYSLIAVTVAVGFYFWLQRFFRRSSRELQRLESIAKSPIFAHFTETIGGLSTIRAFGHEQRFIQKLHKSIDTCITADLMKNTANRWLQIQLEFMGAFVTFFVSLTGVIAVRHYNSSPAYTGLAIIYVSSVHQLLSYIIRSTTAVEQNGSSVERVLEYTNMNQESHTEDDKECILVSDAWPAKGNVEFKGVSLRYDKDLQTIVHDLSVSIEAGTKVGICGRTGSGKSSITLSLFRMINKCAGGVTIDDIDIGQVPLSTLRSRLSIIPQDPLMFTGTVRSNLDPTLNISDNRLWEALEKAQLKSVVKGFDKGLDAAVSEGGSNFSVGQRQLFCLARAFLRHSKVLVMDEATASVDLETDDLVQNVIQRVFALSTVIIIAHRISTIAKCDRVLVMEDGRLVEQGSPEDLMDREESRFSQLVKNQSLA